MSCPYASRKEYLPTRQAPSPVGGQALPLAPGTLTYSRRRFGLAFVLSFTPYLSRRIG